MNKLLLVVAVISLGACTTTPPKTDEQNKMDAATETQSKQDRVTEGRLHLAAKCAEVRTIHRDDALYEAVYKEGDAQTGFPEIYAKRRQLDYLRNVPECEEIAPLPSRSENGSMVYPRKRASTPEKVCGMDAEELRRAPCKELRGKPGMKLCAAKVRAWDKYGTEPTPAQVGDEEMGMCIPPPSSAAPTPEKQRTGWFYDSSRLGEGQMSPGTARMYERMGVRENGSPRSARR